MILIAATCCLLALAATALAKTYAVSVNDNAYSPKSLSFKKGNAVRWTWRGSNRHNVKVRTGPVKFKSTTKRSGTFSHTFKTKGTYKIFCTVHADTMKSTITVK